MSEGDRVHADEWVPEFEGQRPPFAPGNVPANAFEPGNVPANAKHGAFSPRKVEPLAQEIVDAILTDESVPAYAKAPAYRLELWALARAESQAQLITEWLASQLLTGTDVPDLSREAVGRAYVVLHRAETRAASGRSRLGLNPMAAARLGKTVAQGQVASVDLALRMKVMAELDAQGWRPPSEQGDGGAGDG